MPSMPTMGMLASHAVSIWRDQQPTFMRELSTMMAPLGTMRL